MQEHTNATKGQRWLAKLWKRVRRPTPPATAEQLVDTTGDLSSSMRDSGTTPTASPPQDTIHSICQRLADNNDMSLITLDLREQHISIEDVEMLSNALRMNDTLRMLNMGSNDLGDDGVLEIMRGLQNHETIQYLLLSRNKIVNVNQLGPLLLQVPSLIWLDLSENQIHDADPLFEAVGKHTKLELLDLSLNQIANGTAIAQALEKSTTLHDLNLLANHLDNDAAVAISKSTIDSSLVKLNLGYNRIGNLGGKALTKALNKSPTLKELNLAGNQISHQEAIAMKLLATA